MKYLLIVLLLAPGGMASHAATMNMNGVLSSTEGVGSLGVGTGTLSLRLLANFAERCPMRQEVLTIAFPALSESAIINVGLILASGLCGLIVSTWLSRRKRAVEESDFGRRFGWLIERDGEIVGELEYLRWDSYSQFWHEYRVVWRRPEDAVVSPDAWIAAKLVLRNRRYTDIVADAFLTSQDPDTGIVSVRGAYVPEKRIRRGNKL